MKNFILISLVFSLSMIGGYSFACSGCPEPINGIDGRNGTDGRDGVDGIDGQNGTTGTSGQDGRNGINGTNGATGSTGTAGTAGRDGTVGPTGARGLQGIQGPGIDQDELRAGIAGAMALSNIGYPRAGEWAAGGGYGYFENESAFAAGIGKSFRHSGRLRETVLKGTAFVDQHGEIGAVGSVNFHW